jgi:hypothetical protein
MCVTVLKKCVALMLLRAYRAAGLQVNMLKDNIEMDIKGMTLMTSGLNMFNILSYDHSYQPRYLIENDEYLDQLV